MAERRPTEVPPGLHPALFRIGARVPADTNFLGLPDSEVNKMFEKVDRQYQREKRRQGNLKPSYQVSDTGIPTIAVLQQELPQQQKP